MNEHLDFLSASVMVGHLQNKMSLIVQALQKPQYKGDINMMAELRRIQNDIEQLDRVMTGTSFNILSGFQVKYNCQFKYLLNKPKLDTKG